LAPDVTTVFFFFLFNQE